MDGFLLQPPAVATKRNHPVNCILHRAARFPGNGGTEFERARWHDVGDCGKERSRRRVMRRCSVPADSHTSP